MWTTTIVAVDTAVIRHVAFRADQTDESGTTLKGLAVPFNQPTRIDNWHEGTFDEQFHMGAFKRTLGMRTPVLQFDHGTHPLIGSLPIGTFTELRETRRGLEVEAQIFGADLFAPLREALATDAIDGMSIRFRPIRIEVTEPEARTDDGDVELRTVTEAELIELGPVIFPAYAGTSVDMRSVDLTNENDRLLLARALLGGVAPTGHEPGHPTGPGTAPIEAGAPAERTGPASSHPEPDAPPPTHRARRARLHRHQEYISNGHRTSTEPADGSR